MKDKPASSSSNYIGSKKDSSSIVNAWGVLTSSDKETSAKAGDASRGTSAKGSSKRLAPEFQPRFQSGPKVSRATSSSPAQPKATTKAQQQAPVAKQGASSKASSKQSKTKPSGGSFSLLDMMNTTSRGTHSKQAPTQNTGNDYNPFKIASQDQPDW